MRYTRSLRSVIFVAAMAFALIAVAAFVVNATGRSSIIDSNSFDAAPGSEPLRDAPVKSISIALLGDVNFADGWGADYADANGGQVAAAFTPELLQQITAADITYANHEFTMSDEGVPLPKYFTFRASPTKVGYWQQMGVDIVGLANNHAYDYGEAAFTDTLAALSDSRIKYVGAGRSLTEAMAPVFFEVDGYKVAFIAADRSQKGDEPRAAAASDVSPGVLFCFDDALFLQAVASAAASADYVIAIPHWGTEGSTDLEEVQLSLAKKLIDAGADAVVGAHPHILQGIDFYRGKLIAYSLGNFWFNWETIQTAVLNIEIINGQPAFKIVPALQTEQQVITSEAIVAEVLAEMRALSPGVEISDEGYVTART